MEYMGMNKKFWHGKNVFITGHTGFKGGWLSLWLHSLGAKVFGYSLAPAGKLNFFEATSLHHVVTSCTNDILSLDSLIGEMSKFQPDIAFHLAAQPLVRKSYQAPVDTYNINVMGTVHFLEAVRQTPSVRAAIVVTTDKCYENQESIWGYRESDTLGGYDPYSSSKGCAELVSTAYRRSFFSSAQVQLATVRAGNVIGGGDWSDDRLFPDMIRAFSSERDLIIRAPGAIRPWQYVLDPLRGYLMLAENMWQKNADYSSGWNFGPADSDLKSVEEVVRKSALLWGENVHWSISPGPHPHEALTLKLDCTKAKVLLHWQPALGLDDALEWTIDWYKSQQKGTVNLQELSLRQITTYETLI